MGIATESGCKTSAPATSQNRGEARPALQEHVSTPAEPVDRLGALAPVEDDDPAKAETPDLAPNRTDPAAASRGNADPIVARRDLGFATGDLEVVRRHE